jgi:hypothetical protein
MSRRTTPIASSDGCSGLTIDVDGAGHVYAKLDNPSLGADLAQAG